MALEDLTPFGTAPKFYEGLLGVEDTAALQKRAQIQGLLGAGLALAKGMSAYGPPRSALQNILGSVASGFEGAGGAYQQGLQNYQTQQQIQQSQLQREQLKIQRDQALALQQDVQKVMQTPEVANNPSLVALLRADPKKALEFINSNMAISRAYNSQPQPQAPRLDGAEKVLPSQEAVAPLDDRGRLMLVLKNLQGQGGEDIRKEKEVILKQIEAIDKQEEKERKLTDLTNEDIRVANYLFPNRDPFKPLNAEQSKQLNVEIQRLKNERAKSGASKLVVDYGAKTLAAERAKGVNVAEEAAINAGSAASDVRAIVDVLKPYQGGPLQSLAATVGSYLPGTSLQQMSTANDVANSIRSRLAPTLRVAGSGATSDFEAKQFLNAIPSLMQTPQGRELMAVYSEKLANRAAAAADIRASMVEDGTYSLKNFQQKLKEQGFDRVFTTEEIASLTNKKVEGQATPKFANPNTPNLLDFYAPRKPK
jgi:hypothetical protein